MSAPLSRPLFHGTLESLKIGSNVEPRTGWSWAHEDPLAAANHTRNRLNGFGEDSRQSDQGVLFGNVYEVEEHKDDDSIEQNANAKGVVTSKKGFKVKKLHKIISTGDPYE